MITDDYGIIINMNSIAGHIVAFQDDVTDLNVYQGSKFAVTVMTEVMIGFSISLEKELDSFFS